MVRNLREQFTKHDEISFLKANQKSTKYGNTNSHVFFCFSFFSFFLSSVGFIFNFFFYFHSLFPQRRVAAGYLFELLVLKTDGWIDLKQDAPYGDIVFKPTDNFPMQEA